MNRTLICYSANREDPKVEEIVIENMRKHIGDMPIVSVSQKPMDLGENVCVGDVGLSALNCRRQKLMACKMAKTEYVVIFETDILYPPEYFTFEPNGEKLYRYKNNWLMWLYNKDRTNFYNKPSSFDGAEIVKRDFLIYRLEKFLEEYPGWYTSDKGNNPGYTPYMYTLRTYLPSENPLIHVKTGKSLHDTTTMDEDSTHSVSTLPYWGDVDKLRGRFL